MKKWYVSKIVALGIITTLIGVVPLVAEFLEAGVFSPAAVGTVITGVLIIISRIWFTTEGIE